jgi:hypothetical protein
MTVEKVQSTIVGINHIITLTLRFWFGWLLNLSLIVRIVFSARATLVGSNDIVVDTFVEFLDSMISTKGY